MWSADGQHALLVIRSQDNKTRWITRLDAASGKVTALDVQQDDAWIGGPGVSSWGGSGTLLWYPDARHFLMQSEATGWSHFYRVDAQTGAQSQLTRGEFEVSDPALSADGRTLTFTSTEHSAHERHRYSMPATGGARTRLTSRVGHHDVVLDPRGEIVAQTFSTANAPPEVYVGDARITHSTTPDWEATSGARPRSSKCRRRTAPEYRRGFIAPIRPMPTEPLSCSCTARATCTTSTADGAPTFASTCFTTC